MVLSRRELAFGLATGTGMFTAGFRDEDENENEEFCPDIELSSDGLSFRLDYDSEPDSVTVHTADGTAHEFTGEMAPEGGYRRGWPELHIDDGWYGPIERVAASKGSKTIVVEDESERSLEVTCSLWKTPDTRPGDFRMSYENASLMYDPPMGDISEYGSPGRVLESVEDLSSELYVDFENRRDCEPEEDVAVVFDCTSVTVHPEEFVNGVEEIYRPQLTFADGSRELLDGRNVLFEPPVTFAGTGENAGKVIERLHFWNSPGGEAHFAYWNPDVGDCDVSAESDGETGDTDGDSSVDTEERIQYGENARRDG